MEGFSTENNLKVNIVTVLYNSAHCYVDYFKNVEKCGVEHTLLLVDNNSRREQIDAISRFLKNNHFLRRLPNNVMFTPASNIGLQHSAADWYLLLNPDTFLVKPGWLREFIRQSEEVGADIAGCKLVNRAGMINHAGAFTLGDEMDNRNNIHRGYGLYTGFDKADEVDWVTGGCMLIRGSVIQKIGYLPLGETEQYKHYHSDRVFCRTARRAGLKVCYIPAIVGHDHGGSTR